MHALSKDLRAVIERHLRAAPPRQLLAIATALCADDSGVAPETTLQAGVTPSAQPPRFTVHGDLIYDAQLDLTWTRSFVPGGKRNHADAMKAAEAFEFRDAQGGVVRGRAPTVAERVSINDYSRCRPALDTTVFESPPEGWEWTGTLYAPSPSGCAWAVGFDGGGSGGNYRDGGGFVRAVCPGQIS